MLSRKLYMDKYLFTLIIYGCVQVIFSKISKNITAIEGETVVFRCDIELESYGLQRSWTNKTRVIYANENKLPLDKRISLIQKDKKNYAIQVNSVTVHDEGDYTCTVYNTKTEQYALHLQVNVPPRLVEVSRDVVIDEGDTTILTCAATGKPKPKISWRHLVPSADGIRATSPHLPLGRVSRESAGTYECTADNKISAPVKGSIRVTVRYPPEMDGKSFTIQDIPLNTEVQLECVASSVPEPQFTWHHPSSKTFQKTQNGGRIKVLNIKRGNTVASKLILRKTLLQDFGNYTCIAGNKMGHSQRIIKLRRVKPKPTRPPPGIIFGNSKKNPNSAVPLGTKLVNVLSCTILSVFIMLLV